jgi:serine/threonine protein kinase
MPVRGGRPEELKGNSLRGRRLAHFELIAPVGVGGMAAVIKGRDLQLDRTVALKVLPPEMAADPENVRRFHQEARAAAKLDHENIARVFFCGEDQKLHFIAFEFVQGENLRIILERRGRLPVGEAVNYILQVATGLAHAAARGVVHRDIKPSNIIITPTGRAKLVDMGLARSLAPQDDHGLTQSGVTLGTFDYISPEQALEPRDADVRSDIYSLGCTFYHMLTGQPPVPEGTAARKLHCHQHEAPVDPRQLNPDVPDEVAAILARMMAKEPRDRYQRPEHLVQHLLRVAQKLDTSHSRADGVLFVDAPLAVADGARPLLLTALAVAAVIVLVFVLQQSTPSDSSGVRGPWSVGKDTRPQPTDRAQDPGLRSTDKTTDKGPGASDKAERVQPAPSSERDTATFQFNGNYSELRKFLEAERHSKRVIEITLRADLVIGSRVPGRDSDFLTEGLILRGRRISIKGARPTGADAPPTIWLTYRGELEKETVKTALTLEAEEGVVLKGLRVVVYGGGLLGRTAVNLKGGGEHEIEDCQFIQVSPSSKPDEPLCSVLLTGVTSLTAARPKLRLSRCAFIGGDARERGPSSDVESFALENLDRGGRDAVTRRNQASIKAEHCVFGPHQNCFRLEGTNSPTEEDVELVHCTALLGEGSAVFHLGPEMKCWLNVYACLFSHPAGIGPAQPATRAVLIRQVAGLAAPQDQAVHFVGRANRYHNLDSYWDGRLTSFDLRDFRDRLRPGGGDDSSSQVVRTSPWDNDPLASLGQLRLAAAFGPRKDAPQLRLPGLANTHLIGTEWCAGRHYTEDLPPMMGSQVGNDAVVHKEKVVDPKVRGLLTPESGVYRTLAQALGEAQDGDVVLIRHNGLMPIPPVSLETLEKSKVTIKPAPGYRPVLTLATAKREAALFDLLEGKIIFQQLEFLLDPGKGGGVQGVVSLLGGGSCIFEQCTITLAEPGGCRLAAILVDAGTRRGPESALPSIRLEGCLVRGNGDLVWCRSGRPFTLEAENTLAVVTGSVLSVDGLRGDEPEKAKTTLDFRRVTAVVGGEVLRLRPANKDLKGIVPLTCKPTDCIFTSLLSKSLVAVAGSDADETALKDKLAWSGSKNAYNVSWLVEQIPGGGMMRKTYDREKWKTFSGETDGKFLESIKFATPPDIDHLADARPAQFGVSDTDLKGFGCDVGSLRVPFSGSSEE